MVTQNRDRNGETYTQRMHREDLVRGFEALAKFCKPGFDVSTLRAGMAQVESQVDRYENVSK